MNPVGVFDSGVGGLSVLRAIRQELPAEPLIYVADSGFAPYGERSPAFVQARASSIAAFLVGKGAKTIVVACNTATSLAIDALRAQFRVPMIGIEPAVKPAATMTKSGVVGVLATHQTLASPKFSQLVNTYGAHVEVLVQPCPLLVEQIEKGELRHERTRALLAGYVAPLLAGRADIIVLGCTHFAFLSEELCAVVGPDVMLLDPAVAVAREVRCRLEVESMLADADRKGTEQFWTTGHPAGTQAVIGALWQAQVVVQRVQETTNDVIALRGQ